MKKIDESLSERIRFLRLYRDDIEQIYEIFKEYSEKVIIQIDDNELDNIKEISDLRQEKAKRIIYRIENPGIQLEFDSISADVDIYKVDAMSAGIWQE